MTNETTASRPFRGIYDGAVQVLAAASKPTTCGACGANEGERCRTMSDDRCDAGKHVASQPKSIGDDAPDDSAFLEHWDATAHEYGADAFGVAYKAARTAWFAAPAVQASATIQAAPVGWEPVYMTWNDTIMAWVDVGLAEYEAAEPEERRTTYQPAEVN